MLPALQGQVVDDLSWIWEKDKTNKTVFAPFVEIRVEFLVGFRLWQEQNACHSGMAISYKDEGLNRNPLL